MAGRSNQPTGEPGQVSKFRLMILRLGVVCRPALAAGMCSHAAGLWALSGAPPVSLCRAAEYAASICNKVSSKKENLKLAFNDSLLAARLHTLKVWTLVVAYTERCMHALLQQVSMAFVDLKPPMCI